MKKLWNEPLGVMIDQCYNIENPSLRHTHILYTYGLILRYLAATLAAYYLHNSYNDSKIDRCIITDLRRPTYGNLLGFLRYCTKSKNIEWGLLNDLILNIKRLFKKRSSMLPNIPNSTPILDAFISYRNNIVHAGSTIKEEEAKLSLIPLEKLLSYILESLNVMQKFNILIKKEAHLQTQKESMSLEPFIGDDDSSFIGIMEGFDTKKKVIRFVSTSEIWESSQKWNIWESLLQRRGLLEYSWSQVNLELLKNRSLATLPDSFIISNTDIFTDETIENIKLCFDENKHMQTSDPILATIALISKSEKIVFVLTENDAAWKMNAYKGLSALIGIQEGIENLPEEHPLEELLQSVLIIIVSTSTNPNMESWKSLEYDFSGLEIITISKSIKEGFGYTFDKDLIKELFDDLSREYNNNSTWSSLPEIFTNWIDSIEKIHFALDNWRDLEDKNIDPLYIWKKYLDRLLHSNKELSTLEDYYFSCSDPHKITHKEAFETLHDLELLHYSADGTLNFSNEWIRAALYWYIVENTSGRQKKRIVNNPPIPTSFEIARSLYLANNKEKISFSADSQGLNLFLAYGAIENIELNANSKNLIFACTHLINWGYPEVVDRMMTKYFDSINHTDISSDELLALGVAVRNHGSASLAYKIFKQISEVSEKLRTRAKHEMAGILRDRGENNDYAQASEIYTSVLKETNLECEQYVRSACGAAENLYLNNHYDQAITLLEEALKKTDTQRLRAIVHHRTASAHSQYGEYKKAYFNSQKAIDYFNEKFSGSFASRCLDTHSRILIRFSMYEEAIHYATLSLKIKRALGNRRGLQMSLLFISNMIESTDIEKANKLAMEALNLAIKSNDIKGQLFAHRHLLVINNDNKEIVQTHQEQINRLNTKQELKNGI